jgi:hypothetical protein
MTASCSYRVSFVVLYSRTLFFYPEQNLHAGVKIGVITLYSSFTVECQRLVLGIESLGGLKVPVLFRVLFGIVHGKCSADALFCPSVGKK